MVVPSAKKGLSIRKRTSPKWRSLIKGPWPQPSNLSTKTCRSWLNMAEVGCGHVEQIVLQIASTNRFPKSEFMNLLGPMLRGVLVPPGGLAPPSLRGLPLWMREMCPRAIQDPETGEFKIIKNR